MLPFKITEIPGLPFDLIAPDGRGGAVAIKDGVVYTFTPEQVREAVAAVVSPVLLLKELT